MKIAFADFQGFVIDTHFYPKELTIKINEQMLHMLVKPPKEYSRLNEEDRKQVHYLEKHFHGLRYSSGNVEYDLVTEMLENFFEGVHIIYVKGSQKEKFLQTIPGIDHSKIINIEKLQNDEYMEVPKFEKEVPQCLHHIKSSKYMCSLRNCEKMEDWLQNYHIGEFYISDEDKWRHTISNKIKFKNWNVA